MIEFRLSIKHEPVVSQLKVGNAKRKYYVNFQTEYVANKAVLIQPQSQCLAQWW
jgi:hypothetical protein